MKKLSLLLFLLFGLAVWSESPVSASGYANGYVEDGYTYNNGYWYLNGQAYTRARWWQPGREGYYLNSGYGCSLCRVYVPGYAGYYFYKYAAYYPAQQELPKYTDPGWRTKLLDIAAARDKVEGDIRKSAFDHQQYLEAVNALGLQNNFRWNGYGQAPPYSAYGYQAVNYGVNAGTQYGYQANAQATVAHLYGDTNLNSLFQQAAQLTQGAQRLSGEATTGFQALVGAEGGNRARVAEIIAKGQMAAQVLNALAAAPSAEVRGYSFKVTQGKIERVEDPKVVTPDQKAALKEQFGQLASAKCYSCHNDKNAQGKSAMFPEGFKIADYFLLTVEQKNRVWEVLGSEDPKKRMPLAEGGGPGVPLTVDEKRLFFLN